MKKLITLYSRFEADILAQRLQAEGLGVVVNGAKEYASIVTGKDVGRFEIEILPEDFDRGLGILEQFRDQSKIEDPDSSIQESLESQKRLHLRRAMILAALGATVIPVLPSVFGVSSFLKYFRNEKSQWRYFWLLVFLGLNLMMIFLVTFFLRRLWSLDE